MRNLVASLHPHLCLRLALMALAALTAVTSPASVAAQGGDEAAVRGVLMQDAAAIERGDLAALDRLWANDESVTVVENGHANYGWADYRDRHLAPELKEMKNLSYKFSDIKVRLAGGTAWATFRYALAADFKGRRVEANGLATAILERRDGAWKIVHWHSSSPRRAAQPPPAQKGAEKH
jgi:ketosteroid isomerase-like protein